MLMITPRFRFIFTLALKESLIKFMAHLKFQGM